MRYLIICLLLLSLVSGAGAEGRVLADGFTGWLTQTSSGWSVTRDQLSSNWIAFTGMGIGPLTWEDYEVNLTLTMDEYGSQWAGARILVRSLGPQEGYGVTVGANSITLYRYDGYGKSVMMGSHMRSTPIGSPLPLRIKAQGNRIQVFSGEQKLIDAVDHQNRYPYGNLGFRSELARFKITDFSVYGTEVTDPENRRRAEANLGLPIPMPEGRMHPASDPRNAGARDILLVYEQQGNMNWMSIDALPYVGYLSPELQASDWFFDTFLFLGISAPGGRNFGAGDPALLEDWIWWLDRIFNSRTGLAGFNRAVTTVGNQLYDDEHKAKVIIMIPYPMQSEAVFGEINGEVLDFTISRVGADRSVENRLKAVNWYMDEVLRRWEEANFDRLEFIGFYWFAEEMDRGGIDMSYLPRVGERIREMGYSFYWIPWYQAPGYTRWQEAGFDAVMMQPNYMFTEGISRSRLESAAAEARRYGLGIEIEAEGDVFRSASARERYLDYLRAGVEYGWDGDVLRGWYQGVNVFGRAAMESDPEIRRLYDLTYQFVKGEFTQGFFE